MFPLVFSLPFINLMKNCLNIEALFSEVLSLVSQYSQFVTLKIKQFGVGYSHHKGFEISVHIYHREGEVHAVLVTFFTGGEGNLMRRKVLAHSLRAPSSSCQKR